VVNVSINGQECNELQFSSYIKVQHMISVIFPMLFIVSSFDRYQKQGGAK
jgi:hypothetical protein